MPNIHLRRAKTNSVKIAIFAIHARPSTQYAPPFLPVTRILRYNHLPHPLPHQPRARHKTDHSQQLLILPPTMSSKNPSPHSSEHVFVMAAGPVVPKYDHHDDAMGLIKHLGVLEIPAGRPDPFHSSAPPLRSRAASWGARESSAASAPSRATVASSVRGSTGPRARLSAS